MCKISFIFIIAVGVYGISNHGNNISNGYLSVAYYVNWAVYGRNYTPQDLPADKLTHVLYAFSNIKPDTGVVYLSDSYADTEKRFPNDSLNETENKLHGCLKQLYLLKKGNRNLKVLLSIGGWSYSSNFALPASTVSGRSAFASSAVSLLANFGFDGLDIDWEYPETEAQAMDMVMLLKSVREALDDYAQSLAIPYHFKLTVAAPAGPTNYQRLHLSDMDQYIDFWNLMAYDYTGSWSPVTGNQANLFTSANDTKSTPFNTESVIKYYTSKGVDAKKIVLGMPLYGRSFQDTDGLGKSYSGVGAGTWESGIYDIKVLPLAGSITYYNEDTASSYSYDNNTKELVSYDTVEVAKQKADWIRQIGLGGAMWWESSADKLGSGSLIQTVKEVLGGEDGSGLEMSLNQLYFPNSTYSNLQADMPTYTPALPLCTS
ncbi:chitinase [Bisporella sp. PMI_857]|nr:chitinase [Bisporella sp. PMI_857]